MNEIFEQFIVKEIPKEEDTDNSYWKDALYGCVQNVIQTQNP